MILTEPRPQNSISPYIVPGLRFKNMPEINQEEKAKAIIVKVCEFFNAPILKVVGKKRDRIYIPARFWCMWFIRCHTNLSLKETGALFSNRDHTTVINAINFLKDQLSLKHDNDTKDQYRILIQII